MLRFAPSPTGDIHIGNLRIALINYIVAKQRQEELIIRIEDTDQGRNIVGKDREIVELLKLFGIEYKEVLYQSANFNLHRQLAYRLVEEGKAFLCFCSEEELAEERKRAQLEKRPYRYSGKCATRSKREVGELLRQKKPFTIRVYPPEKPIPFTDLIKGKLEFTPFEVDSFIILRQNGIPTYNFACAVDDMIGNISIVIRGEDHLSNTPKQIYIRQLLGYSKSIQYAHIPIILNSVGKKMSKREQSSSVKWLLEEGFLPEAIGNYLLLLGNSFQKEIFTLKEGIEIFDLTKISKSPARFDLEKLKFINRHHIRRLVEEGVSIVELLAQFKSWKNQIKKRDKRDGKDLLYKTIWVEKDKRMGKGEGLEELKELEGLAKLYLDEVATLKELLQKLDRFYWKPTYKQFEKEVEILKREILELSNRELPVNYNQFKKELMAKTGLKGKRFFMPLRLLLIGQSHGPEIRDLYTALFPIIPKLIANYR